MISRAVSKAHYLYWASTNLLKKGSTIHSWAINTPPIDGSLETAASFWVNYHDLTATSLEIMVNKGNHPQMALIQVSEIL